MSETATELAEVSIHAPVKGATGFSKIIISNIISFNSRSREGSDQNNAYNTPYEQRFNSRSREGSDRKCR